MTIQTEQPYRSIWSDLRQTAFEQRYIDAGGIRTRYAHAGTQGKPAIVMLHGTAGHWEAFAPNLGAHAKHFDCFALDMIGCGFSDKPDRPYEIQDYCNHVLAFMDAVGIQKASLLGCSLGAWVAAAIAKDRRDRVEKLILLSAAGYFSNAQNRDRIKSVRTSAVDDPSWSVVKAIFDHLLAKEASRIDDIIALRQAIYRLPNMKRAMQNILVLQDAEVRARNLIDADGWRSIMAPTLLVGSLAHQDEYLETARVVSKLIPNATYVEMQDVGHWPQFEDPDTFNQLSTGFLLKK